MYYVIICLFRVGCIAQSTEFTRYYVIDYEFVTTIQPGSLGHGYAKVVSSNTFMSSMFAIKVSSYTERRDDIIGRYLIDEYL